MPHVTPPLPNNGDTAYAEDISIPFNMLLAIFNGHIGPDNLEPGSMPWSVMSNFTNSIPASAMRDSGNLEKYRDESNVAFVASGLVWTKGSELSGSMTAGIAYTPNGERHSVNAVNDRSFTSLKDTYVSILSNGSLDYVEVSNGGTPPSFGANALPLALVVTGATEILATHDLRPRSSNEVGRMTLGGNSDRITVSNIPTWAKSIEIDIILVPDGVIDTRLIFNNDTGNNYSETYSTNYAVASTTVNRPGIDLEVGNGIRTEASKVTVTNIATFVKLGQLTTVHNDASDLAGDGPVVSEISFKWANKTNLINRIDLINMTAGDFAAGSQMVVRALP